MLNDTHWLKFCQAMGLPNDESFATLRQRKKAREQVETLVKAAVAARTFDAVAARLSAAGVGFTEVLPLERVLDAPQARHPGKLRDVRFRGFEFSIPEFPSCMRAKAEHRLNLLPVLVNTLQPYSSPPVSIERSTKPCWHRVPSRKRRRMRSLGSRASRSLKRSV